jgi:phage FluMu protein Com
MIGGMKCSGEKAMCAHCLKNGKRTEETAAHVHYKCPKAKAVWQVVMADWNEKTGDHQMSTLRT